MRRFKFGSETQKWGMPTLVSQVLQSLGAAHSVPPPVDSQYTHRTEADLASRGIREFATVGIEGQD